MADYVQLLVRLIHVFFGLVWVGGLVFFGHAVGGAMRKLPGPIAGPASLAIGKRMSNLFAIAAPVTVVFGVINQYMIAGNIAYEGSLWNISLGASLIIGVVMLILGFGVSRPSLMKLIALVEARPAPAPGTPPAPPTPEMVAIQQRMMKAGMTVTALGVIAVVLMVVAVLARNGML
ncbi:MAG TPA: hypothetical protein VM889_12125 [Candidatus Thermoplasmatota archaeon]|nr:hypothetical protein [Candidatus Thermoplasmatota archaeon]